MNAKEKHQMSGAVDQGAFEKAIRENLSPEGITAIIALLQPTSNYRNDTSVNTRALDQIEGFRETLLDIIGFETFNDLVNEIGM